MRWVARWPLARRSWPSRPRLRAFHRRCRKRCRYKLEALRLRNGFGRAERRQYPHQMLYVADLDRDVESVEARITVHQRQVDDVGAVRAQYPGHDAE